ncbi:MAG: GNAT family N-acetyltransferase [Coriobacteriia bacterium]
MRFPERIETARLALRCPQAADVEAIFSGWASDPLTTRYMAWPRHCSIEDTNAFLRFSDQQWANTSAGPYAIVLQSTGELIGTCGFAFRSSDVAEIGYILKRSCWGIGYATESVRAQIEAAGMLGDVLLAASVHPANASSVAVLERCGFVLDSDNVECVRFPNLETAPVVEVLRYTLQVGHWAGRVPLSYSGS